MGLKSGFGITAFLSCITLTGTGFTNPENQLDKELYVPAVSYWGTRGLSQTASAEPLGYGRLGFSLSGTYYKQDQSSVMLPTPQTNIGTGRLSASFGLNSYMDAFGSLSYYRTMRGGTTKSSGVGSVMGGVQGSLPLPSEMPFRLGAQVYFIGGFADDQIASYRVDGFDYFDTRTDYDAVAKLTQSIVLGTPGRSLKFHFNEGYVKTLGNNQAGALLLAAGIQGEPADFLSLGVELNSRTRTDNITLSDPFWITPSVMFRTPYYMGFVFGSDISLSSSRESNSSAPAKALEPYRLFGEMTFSFDLLASKRKADAEKKAQEEAEKEKLKKEAEAYKLMADSLNRKAQADSIKAAQTAEELAQKAKADSLKAAEATAKVAETAAAIAKKAEEDSIRAKAVADSLDKVAQALAQKAKQDSIALEETKKKLEEEKSKRSDAEKQLLSTGLLILDAVYFESGKTEISLNSRPYLNIIGKMLLKYPKLKIEIGGHTDNTGRLETNIALSQKRAESVNTYLTSIEPQLTSMLTARGYGPSLPKADNSTREGRQINRRVELKVLNPDVLKEYNP